MGYRHFPFARRCDNRLCIYGVKLTLIHIHRLPSYLAGPPYPSKLIFLTVGVTWCFEGPLATYFRSILLHSSTQCHPFWTGDGKREILSVIPSPRIGSFDRGENCNLQTNA